jgi:enediyne biosynthesis protein E4
MWRHKRHFRVLTFTPAIVLCLLTLPVRPAHNQTPKVSNVFAEVSERAGLIFRHYNGMTGRFFLPEIMGAGAALFDFDNDGDLDAFLVQGSTIEPNDQPAKTLFPWQGPGELCGRLFRNDLVAGKEIRFIDVTEKSGIVANGYGMGVAVGDINNDGRQDLYVTNLGSNKMFLNKGNGTFEDVTAKSRTDDTRWSTSASFFDYDRDGWLDLMVVNYADFTTSNSPNCYAPTSAKDYCTPRVFRAPGNRLFHNKGDGTFEDATSAARIDKEFGHGLGVITADLDYDGWLDIYVANDGDPNQLWINQKNGTFKNEALLAGAAVNRNGIAEAGMGVDAGDFDNNGTDDIFITHLMDETNTLFLNLGKGLFEDRTREAGLGMPGRRFTGFGTLFLDYDNDGWLDLLVTNGAVQLLPELMRKNDPFPLGQPNQLFRNTGKGSFVEVMDQLSPEFRMLQVGRGAAFGDIDNDGDTDVLITNNNQPARLFINQVGNQNHWLGLRLVDKSGRDALGARVQINATANPGATKNQVLWRRARTDGSYLNANDPRVLGGLGNNRGVESVRVYWPDGKVEDWKNVPVDRYTALKENTGTPAK